MVEAVGPGQGSQQAVMAARSGRGCLEDEECFIKDAARGISAASCMHSSATHDVASARTFIPTQVEPEHTVHAGRGVASRGQEHTWLSGPSFIH